MFVKILAAIEVFVMDETRPRYLRMIGWWVLLQNWGTLRLSDPKGLFPGQITVKDRGLSGTLSRSKMLGSDKAIGSRLVVVHAACCVREKDWLVGSAVRGGELLPRLFAPGAYFQSSRRKHPELLNSAGFALLNRLLCSLRFPSAPLLDPQVVHFWTPPSGRSFVPSCTEILSFENTQRDFLGWSAQGSPEQSTLRCQETRSASLSTSM